MGGIINTITGGNDSYQATVPSTLQGALTQTNNNYNQTYGQQQALDTQLQNQATNGSTLAQNQLTAATGQNIANATGMIDSQKGLNPALAARQASENAGMANQTAANQSAQLQAQTQMMAQNQLANNLATQGSQAIQYNLGNANTMEQANQINAGVAATNANNAAQTTGGILKAGAGVAAMLSEGGKVQGRAETKGDSLSNDKVPAMLSPGEIVIPRTAAQSQEKAHAFIQELMAKKDAKKMAKGGEVGYKDVLASHNALKTRLDALEKRMGRARG